MQLTDGTIVECRARGRFRRDGKPPLVGDFVRILPQQSGDALIDTILPRRNTLIRPQAANIDRLIIVLSGIHSGARLAARRQADRTGAAARYSAAAAAQ